jgi:hypothetical protein
MRVIFTHTISASFLHPTTPRGVKRTFFSTQHQGKHFCDEHYNLCSKKLTRRALKQRAQAGVEYILVLKRNNKVKASANFRILIG